ncbi:hypothetical protein RQP50_27615 [Paenibacillus sp. chi10]|uniref:Uncharacterized protein n=1 Tax=Paenibacillus suaedae TaxID=3077233 RepID=A0AAJ2K5C4_9BACL|nr:hypothetical protein [Paenibacillus sp. chi10]MDT8980003.1 hypothetical protein [Paenibacillus sp. chi10]
MEINFEQWIKRQDISEEAKMLFDDAVKCYRIGVYRPAFLMSYLGFMKALRDRLLKSPKPHLIHENHWPKVLNDLKDEKLWEERVFTCIEEKEKEKKGPNGEKPPPVSKVFLVSNDIIEDMPHWRKIRNTCAHAKDSIINHSQVEEFWSFVQSHLSKFIVNGGKQWLLEQIDKHFDPKYKKPNSAFDYLIEKIPNVVRSSEIPELLTEIYKEHIDLTFDDDHIKNRFWKEIFNCTDQNVYEAFHTFVTSEHIIFSEFMEAFPEKLMMFSENEELMRYFWHHSLFENIGNFLDCFWILATTLIENEVIQDEEEKRDFVQKLATKIHPLGIPNDKQIRLFDQYGFFEPVKSHFNSLTVQYRGYDNANSKSFYLIYYLKYKALDSEIVKILNSLFRAGYHFGRFYNGLSEFIDSNPNFLPTFREIASKEGIQLADYFQEEFHPVEQS